MLRVHAQILFQVQSYTERRNFWEIYLFLSRWQLHYQTHVWVNRDPLYIIKKSFSHWPYGLLLLVLHEQHVTDIIPRTAGDCIRHAKCQQQSAINSVYCLVLCTLAQRALIISLVAQSCQICAVKREAIICIFFSLSSLCLHCVSALAHELQTSLLIKSDQWRIVRRQRRHELTNLACQTQCKNRGADRSRAGVQKQGRVCHHQHQLCLLYVCSHGQTTDGAPSSVCCLMVAVLLFHPYYPTYNSNLPF